MKKLLLAIPFLCLLLITLGCSEFPPASAVSSEKVAFDLGKCQIVGNHAYIPTFINNTYDYGKYVLPTLQKFEEAKGVRILSYIPQIQDDQVRGIWVTFDGPAQSQ